MTDKRRQPVRKSSSFPTEFFRVYMYVAETGKSLVINNLENRRAAYTTLRARLNQFRRAYYDEAIAENSKDKLNIAEQMYSVTSTNPQKVNDKWQLEIKLKENEMGDKLAEILPSPLRDAVASKDKAKHTIQQSDDDTSSESQAAKTIGEIFGYEEKEG